MNFPFLFKTAIQNISRQKFITFAIVLVFMLIFILLNILAGTFYFSYKFSKYIQQQQLVVQVFFSNDCNENKALVSEFVSKIKDLNIHKTTEYISSQEVFDTKFDVYFKDDPDVLKSKPENPCDLLAEFKIYPIDQAKAKTIFEKVNELHATNKYPINSVAFSKDIQNKWESTLSWVQNIIIVSIIFLGFIVFVVTNMLVDVSIRSRSDEIGIMQLVGAKNSQVRLIFIIEGLIYGLIASILAIVFVSILYYFVFYTNNLELFSFVFNLFETIGLPKLNLLTGAYIIISEILIGSFLGIINNWIAVRKYL